MKNTLLILFVIILCNISLNADNLPNPIMFVTAVPSPNDSSTQTAPFSNHLNNMYGAPRGGDLWIIYTDKSTKNLTQAAGFGVSTGLQGATSIAVREPSIHWSGTKAIFSMIVGGAASQGDNSVYYWQLYEITGFGKNETPLITKVPNQPTEFNNMSPIYGTDDRIIFTSDRTLNGKKAIYPAMDEYKGQYTNTGLWSLNPSTGDLMILDHSPSGDFSPILDSYGKIVLMRWDRLQRDREADLDVLLKANVGTFNYTSESDTAKAQFGVRNESFPEPQGGRTDLLNGTNVVGMEFNTFFPWQINEDGTTPERLGHIGRHDMASGINYSINDDPNVIKFVYNTSGRKNQNPIVAFMQVKESPVTQGKYFGIDAFQSSVHASGQILTLDAQPTLDPDDVAVTYITHRTTATPTFEGNTPNVNHTGLYRNPLPLSNGTLVASHTANTYVEKNLGTTANPQSRFDFRLKTLKLSGSYYIPDQNLTSGISKNMSYWNPDVQVSFNTNMWEIDPVEVVSRTKPQSSKWDIPAIEKQIFADANIDIYKFQKYMKDNNIALATGRDVTHRDKTDKQQPYYLKIAGTNKQSANATGKIYDVSHLQFFQGDYIRGNGMITQSSTPNPGRRILAVAQHDVQNPPNSNGPQGSVKIGNDGSWAGFVHADRATTWQLVSPANTPIVRERYWVTFKPGEVRVCASCHGTNDACPAPKDPAPTNKSQALVDLLNYWKGQVQPVNTPIYPPNDTVFKPGSDVVFKCLTKGNSSFLQFELSNDSLFNTVYKRVVANLDESKNQSAFSTSLTFTNPNSQPYFWRIKNNSSYIDGNWSPVMKFYVKDQNAQVPSKINLLSPLRNFSNIFMYTMHFIWSEDIIASNYEISISTDSLFQTTKYNYKDIIFPYLDFNGSLPIGNYYWKVRGINSNGNGPWSETWNFNIIEKLPNKIILNSPQDKTNYYQNDTISFAWNTDSLSINYQIETSDKSDFSSFIDSFQINTLNLKYTNTKNIGSFYWRVRGNNTSGNGPWSDIWSFNILEKSVDTPDSILLFSPKNKSKISDGLLISIQWQIDSKWLNYEAQLSTDIGFSTNLISPKYTQSNSVTLSQFLSVGTYYWRVRGTGIASTGKWSEVRSFDIIALSVDPEIEKEYNISIYPNPASEKVNLGFETKELGIVNISVYDITGRKVATLINKELSVGQQNFEWSPIGLARQSYFIEIKTSKFTFFKEIILK